MPRTKDDKYYCSCCGELSMDVIAECLALGECLFVLTCESCNEPVVSYDRFRSIAGTLSVETRSSLVGGMTFCENHFVEYVRRRNEAVEAERNQE